VKVLFEKLRRLTVLVRRLEDEIILLSALIAASTARAPEIRWRTREPLSALGTPDETQKPG
jgi:hypothetical protein